MNYKIWRCFFPHQDYLLNLRNMIDFHFVVCRISSYLTLTSLTTLNMMTIQINFILIQQKVL